VTPAAVAVVDLGRRRYGEVLELQRALCRRRLDGLLDQDLLLLVEHEPVVTLGRGTREASLPLPAESLTARGLEVFEVERGGDVTVHAPGQLVGYPILDLSRYRRDLHWYLRQLEETLIRALADSGVAGQRSPGLTGVWVRGGQGGRKIASIGIHVKQWVTFHGFALNVSTELSLFDLVVPCGIPGVVMTSIARETGAVSDPPALWAATMQRVVHRFSEVFERELQPWPADRAAFAAVAPSGAG